MVTMIKIELTQMREKLKCTQYLTCAGYFLEIKKFKVSCCQYLLSNRQILKNLTFF